VELTHWVIAAITDGLARKSTTGFSFAIPIQMFSRVLIAMGLFGSLHFASAQQISDLDYRPAVPRPAYAMDAGPRIAIDEAHNNFHTATGRYQPFAELLRRDGYRVQAIRESFTRETLRTVEILVIANPLHARNVRDWSLPTPSAYMADEVTALRRWTEDGGSLLLIADHMPFPGAASEVANAFGAQFSNGYARDGRWRSGQVDLFEMKNGLAESAITRGRNDDERITSVATFGGSAFKPPQGATRILIFGTGSISAETTKAPGITPGAPKIAIDGWCQGAAWKVGRGRIAVFGEAAMFSAQRAGPDKRPMGMNAPEARQNHQLLLNVMHWLSRAEQMEE
jgi:hypothetical protein